MTMYFTTIAQNPKHPFGSVEIPFAVIQQICKPENNQISTGLLEEIKRMVYPDSWKKVEKFCLRYQNLFQTESVDRNETPRDLCCIGKTTSDGTVEVYEIMWIKYNPHADHRIFHKCLKTNRESLHKMRHFYATKLLHRLPGRFYYFLPRLRYFGFMPAGRYPSAAVLTELDKLGIVDFVKLRKKPAGRIYLNPELPMIDRTAYRQI